MIKISENIYTKDFAYLVGALLGDGCLYINIKRGCYQFSITSEDKDFCEKCQSITKNIFNKEGRIKTVIKDEKISYYQLVICSKDIVYFLKELTNNKTIIPFFIYSNNENKKEFAKGLMDADGWITKVNASDRYIRYRIGFKNISEWTEKFREILKSLEIKVGKMRKIYNSRSTKKAYVFSINTYDYCVKIGFGINRKEKLKEEFLEFYKNGGNKKIYKNYRFLKECPICYKEYNEHWKVVNHIRKTKDDLHQNLLKEQEREVVNFYIKNNKYRDFIKKMLYEEKNIFAGISYEKIMRLVANYMSVDELKKIRKERISRTMKTVPKTAEHNRRVAEGVKRAWKMGKFHTKENIRARELGYKKRRSYAGKNNPMFGKPCPKGAGFGKGGKRKDLNNQYFRSTWEANLARIFELKKRKYIFEPERFYITINGEEYSYLPDFYFPTKKFYYEIKGHSKKGFKEWICPCDNCRINRKKIKAVIEQYNLKIFLIGNYEYKRLRRIFKKSIKNWER